LPLWPLRIYLRWRVEGQMDSDAIADQPLSIRDMLSGTAVVAVTIGLARAVLLADPMDVAGEDLVIPSAASFGISLCIGIPATLCVLGPANLKAGILVLGSYLLLGVLALVGIPSAVFGGMTVELLVFVLIGAFALTATIAAPLLVLRSCGYRLTRPRERRGRATATERAFTEAA
jgi:hypothetical protein